MTQATVITQIKAALNTLIVPPRKIYVTPPEATNLADFPCVVLAIPDNQTMSFVNDNLGRRTHNYSVILYLFVGTAALTQYNQLKALAQEWPDKLASVLTPDNLKLTGSVVWLSSESDSLTANYSMGFLNEWGENFYGLRVTLPIVERTTWG